MARIVCYLKERQLTGDFRVEIYDPGGKLITSLPAGKRRGINRVDWAMRLKPPRLPASGELPGAVFGPMAPEGVYPVKILRGHRTHKGEHPS